jgi:hypothetical protein
MSRGWEITTREQAEAQARQDRQASAVARLERAQAGESVVGRIGWPKPGRIWSMQSPASKPSWTVGPR